MRISDKIYSVITRLFDNTTSNYYIIRILIYLYVGFCMVLYYYPVDDCSDTVVVV